MALTRTPVRLRLWRRTRGRGLSRFPVRAAAGFGRRARDDRGTLDLRGGKSRAPRRRPRQCLRALRRGWLRLSHDRAAQYRESNGDDDGFRRHAGEHRDRRGQRPGRPPRPRRWRAFSTRSMPTEPSPAGSARRRARVLPNWGSIGPASSPRSPRRCREMRRKFSSLTTLPPSPGAGRRSWRFIWSATCLRNGRSQAELLRIPFAWDPPERLIGQMVMNLSFRLDQADRVIPLKFPAYLIPHRDKVFLAIASIPSGLRSLGRRPIQRSSPRPRGTKFHAAIHAADAPNLRSGNADLHEFQRHPQKITRV